jgi:ADP-ribosyl-[dinitrogen reductase] hydrolase
VTGVEPASPLRIGEASVPETGGVIGMTLCPGKKGPSTLSGLLWDRDLGVDLERIRRWGAEAVVTLMERRELEELQVGHMGDAVTATGLLWFHLPIVDTQAPNTSFEDGWVESGPRIRAILADGGRVLVHCRGGLGRTGVVAARLLMEFGVPVEEAIRVVREGRRHAIETPMQERYLRDLACGPGGVVAAPVPFLAEPWPQAPSRADPIHFAGCLLGGAVGDALGAPVEFMIAQRHEKHAGRSTRS